MIDPARVVQPVGFRPAGYGTDKMGLYRFRDGEAYLVRLHVQSGDWQTMRQASADEKKLIPERVK